MKTSTLAQFEGGAVGATDNIRPYVFALMQNEGGLKLGPNPCGLDIGCASYKLMSSAIGIDTRRGDIGSEYMIGNTITKDAETVNLVGDGVTIPWFMPRTMDYIFSSHMLEHVPHSEAMGALSRWHEVLKNGGMLILYLPDVRCGEMDIHEWHPDHEQVANQLENELGMRDVTVWTPREDLPLGRTTGSLRYSFLLWATK